jgi:hypothetical protein
MADSVRHCKDAVPKQSRDREGAVLQASTVQIPRTVEHSTGTAQKRYLDQARWQRDGPKNTTPRGFPDRDVRAARR